MITRCVYIIHTQSSNLLIIVFNLMCLDQKNICLLTVQLFLINNSLFSSIMKKYFILLCIFYYNTIYWKIWRHKKIEIPPTNKLCVLWKTTLRRASK